MKLFLTSPQSFIPRNILKILRTRSLIYSTMQCLIFNLKLDLKVKMYRTIILLVYFFLFLVIGFRSKAFLYNHVCSPVFLNNNVILRKRYASDISCKDFFTSLHQKMFVVRLYQTFWWRLGGLVLLRVLDLSTHLETYSASYHCIAR